MVRNSDARNRGECLEYLDAYAYGGECYGLLGRRSFHSGRPYSLLLEGFVG